MSDLLELLDNLVELSHQVCKLCVSISIGDGCVDVTKSLKLIKCILYLCKISIACTDSSSNILQECICLCLTGVESKDSLCDSTLLACVGSNLSNSLYQFVNRLGVCAYLVSNRGELLLQVVDSIVDIGQSLSVVGDSNLDVVQTAIGKIKLVIGCLESSVDTFQLILYSLLQVGNLGYDSLTLSGDSVADSSTIGTDSTNDKFTIAINSGNEFATLSVDSVDEFIYFFSVSIAKIVDSLSNKLCTSLLVASIVWIEPSIRPSCVTIPSA